MNIDELREKMKNVPFGNSVFQNTYFTAGKETPERRYRHCILQISGILSSLEECKFRRRRLEIDIEEINEKLKSDTINKFDKMRLEVDLEEKQLGLENELKLIDDTMIEFVTYEKELSSIPDFTREEFENSELKYWKTRLIDDFRREFVSTGSVSSATIQSLEDVGIFILRDKDTKELIFQEHDLKKIE